MKKFIVLVCALFIGSTVSPASSEDLKEYTFSIVGCRCETVEKMLAIKLSQPDVNSAFKETCSTIGTEVEANIKGSVPLIGRVFLKSDAQFLTFIKEKIYTKLSLVIGLQYIFSKTNTTRKTEFIRKTTVHPLDTIYCSSPDFSLSHIMIIVPFSPELIPIIESISEKLDSHNSGALDGLTSYSHEAMGFPRSCAIAECKNIGTAQCGRCLTTHYCSRECQTAAWKEHKKVCKAPDPS